MIWSEWQLDKQHWVFRAGCVRGSWELWPVWMLLATSALNKTTVIVSKGKSDQASPLL